MELEVKELGFPRARQVTLMGVFARVDLCIKAGAFLRISQSSSSFSSDFVEFFSSFSSVVVGTSSSSSSHKSSSSFLSVFNSFSSRSRFPQKVFVNHSSSFKENLQYSGRFLQHIVSIFLRRIKWSSYSPKGNYYTLPKFVEISECSNCDVASFYLEYQWFQSGLNYK